MPAKGQERALGAVILAAGDSQRMGQPKALLRRGDKTFLERWLAVVNQAAVEYVQVVLGRDREAILASVSIPPDEICTNPRPDEGMLSSFLCGLERLPSSVSGAFLCPVDHPDVAAEDLRALRGALAPGRVVVPVVDGRRGHPVLFAADLFAELRACSLEVGARAVVRADPERVIEVPAGSGVLLDVDTPEEYRG